MKLIKYFNIEKEFEDVEYIDENNIKQIKHIIKNEKIVPLEYKCKDSEFQYWLDVIKKTYLKFGDITYEDIEDIKTTEEIQAEKIKKLENDITVLQSSLVEQQYKNLMEVIK
ncbi:hypothetical protein [Clostridium sp. CTA-6]|nr:hypothetical protein [Clostridium botulinum]EKS4396687.1 hypothetical protein [Clostridium botulinum]